MQEELKARKRYTRRSLISRGPGGLMSLHHRTFYGNQTERRRWQNPDSILAEIGLRPGLTFVDVGCGDGFFALPAARIVGKEGRVYALDFDAESISSLEEKASRGNLKNVETRIGNAEDNVFCESCADIVFFGIVLHDFYDPAKVLKNASKMIKPSGRLVDLDWKKQPMNFGPPENIRFSEDEAARLIFKAGFKIEQRREAGPFHYVITAKP
jgi:ubiquinone/menaquinone biosynthesis C-methylase UbiE